MTYIVLAQPYTSSIEINKNWNGWEAVIVKNGIITAATVPAIGARVMQYDLGINKTIYRDSSLNGKKYTPASGAWYNFGGFKNWPAPQYGDGRWSWPPPPTLDYGNYTYEIIADTPDSSVIKVTSPVEKISAPNLQFIREMTIFKNSSHIRMEQFLINKGSTIQNWSVWDNTQCITNHKGKKDYSNFRTYFPINPNSVFGNTGVKTNQQSAGWVGEVAPGIYGTQFTPNSDKLFADPDKGWICFVDERDSIAYAKTFAVTEGALYADDGGRVAVYMGPNYEEVEITGPIQDMPANGGTISFTIDWWAAKVNGTILDVNPAGAIHSALAMQGGVITGNYGVFHVGKAKIAFLDNTDQVISEGYENSVTPLQNFNLAENISIPEKTAKVEIRVYDDNDKLIGVLDNKSIGDLTAVNDERVTSPGGFVLYPNYPNPFNPATTITWEMREASNVKVDVYNFQGRLIQTLVNGNYPSGRHQVVFDASELASGNYLVSVTAGSYRQTKKITLLK
jgi:hypothetical protein